MLVLRADPVSGVLGLGTARVENRATVARRVMQIATIPLLESDNVRLHDPITVLDSGTGQPERCQVERWVAPYPSGAEKVIKVHYPAVLPPNNLSILHTFERSATGVLAPFTLPLQVSSVLPLLRIRFFCGPKATHWVDLVTPGQPPLEVLRTGPRCQTVRYFARLYEPAHAPTLRTQLWCECEINFYSDQNYALVNFGFGVDDDRFDQYMYDRSGFSQSDTEIGFEITSFANQEAARLRTLYPNSNTWSLTWNQSTSTWTWVWDRRTVNAGNFVLNDQLPWGFHGQAQTVLTFGLGETNQQRLDSIAAWYERPYYHPALHNDWYVKQSAYEAVGEVPRRNKTHETVSGRDFTFIRTQLENECSGEIDPPSNHGLGEGTYYAWNHWTGGFEGLGYSQGWHPPDGQGPGAHAYWRRSPCLTAVHYQVPGQYHYLSRAIRVCPWFYSGYRERDGRYVTGLDHPIMGNNRGQPAAPDSRGKPPAAPSRPALRNPTVPDSLIGADPAHFEPGVQMMHSVLFGDDGTRLMARFMVYGPVFMGTYNLSQSSRGATGEFRAGARMMLHLARALYLFGDDRRLVDWAADVFLGYRIRVAFEQTNVQWPGRIVMPLWTDIPRSEGEHRVNLRLQHFFRPWEICHAPNSWAIARLASHIRAELDWFIANAHNDAATVFRYGSPRIVNEQTGVIEYTYLRPNGSSYEPAAAAAFVAGGTRQLNQAEMANNNWSICPVAQNGICGDPPTNDGFFRLGVANSGTGAFCSAMGQQVLDGPTGAGDIVLTRYVHDAYPDRTERLPSESRPWSKWVENRFRWSVGVAESVVQGPAVTRGTHGIADLERVTVSRTFANEVWISRSGSTQLVRHSISSGAQTAAVTPGFVPVEPWSGVACVSVGGEGWLAMLDGRDPLLNRPSYSIAIAREASVATTLLSWAFTFSDAVPRDVGGIAWSPQLNKWIVAANRLGEPSLWLVGAGETTAQRVSMPAEPGPNRRIILDVPTIWDIDTTTDGRLLVLSSTGGDRHFYAWNRHAQFWGSPRLVAPLGDRAIGFSVHGREDNSLRLVTGTPGTTFQEHAV